MIQNLTLTVEIFNQNRIYSNATCEINSRLDLSWIFHGLFIVKDTNRRK